MSKDSVVIGSSTKQYNDGKPHIVQALRDRTKGKLSVDGVPFDTDESYGDIDALMTTGFLYFGGYPGKHNFIEVTNIGFDGCIDDVKLWTTPVDLNQNKEAFGVIPGCPNKVRYAYFEFIK